MEISMRNLGRHLAGLATAFAIAASSLGLANQAQASDTMQAGYADPDSEYSYTSHRIYEIKADLRHRYLPETIRLYESYFSQAMKRMKDCLAIAGQQFSDIQLREEDIDLFVVQQVKEALENEEHIADAARRFEAECMDI